MKRMAMVIAALLMYSPVVNSAEIELAPARLDVLLSNWGGIYGTGGGNNYTDGNKVITNDYYYSDGGYNSRLDAAFVENDISLSSDTPYVYSHGFSGSVSMQANTTARMIYAFSVNSDYNMPVQLFVDSILEGSIARMNLAEDASSRINVMVGISTAYSPDGAYDLYHRMTMDMSNSTIETTEFSLGIPSVEKFDYNVVGADFIKKYTDEITINTNTQYFICLAAQATGHNYDGAAFSDPYLYLDEDFLTASGFNPADFSLAFSEGVNNLRGECPAPVPEPNTLFLMGAGMLGLVEFARRRRHF